MTIKAAFCILQYTCIIILVFTTICEQILLLTFGDNILVCDFLPKNSSEVVISYTEARTWNLKSSVLLSLICNTLTHSLGFSLLLCANKPSSDAFACAWCWKALTKSVGPMGLQAQNSPGSSASLQWLDVLICDLIFTVYQLDNSHAGYIQTEYFMSYTHIYVSMHTQTHQRYVK